ncbi:MAG: FAD-binding protein, partial [Paludibacteraceae bacterium]|nr:FAD-binding protein [Paludibacteraceae bacterium]
GMVVQINPEDIEGNDPLKGLAFQEELERLALDHGGPQAQAPAQRMRDFVEGKASTSLPSCSYLPGIVPSRLDQWLPAHIGKRLQQGFRDFDRKYPGFLTNEAVIVGVESRSSSAVRIPRDPETLQSVSTPGLYPCGEGAGYAGGITSSALDGINAALKIALQ